MNSKHSTDANPQRSTLSLGLTWLATLALAAGCGGRTESVPRGTDTSSHWLSSCEEGTSCPSGQDCVCGVCTRECDEASDCQDLDDEAVCIVADDCSMRNVCATESFVLAGGDSPNEPGILDSNDAALSDPAPVVSCYQPLDEELVDDPSSTGCACEGEGLRVCTGEQFVCYQGKWSAAGGCYTPDGQCDSWFTNLKACVDAGKFDCNILGPIEDDNPICAIEPWNASDSERPVFDTALCEQIGGVTFTGATGYPSLWVKMPGEDERCIVQEVGAVAAVTDEGCEAVGGHAVCSADPYVDFCRSDETPVARSKDCGTDVGYCCLPDAQ
jgi:hypothetical protein